MNKKPEAGMCLPGTIVAITDGDTLKVEIKLHVNVRLLDVWAPELKQDRGPESRDKLMKYIGHDCLCEIPGGSAKHLGQLMSFGRVLGRIWVDNEESSLNELQVKNEVASTTRHGKLGE